MEDVVCEDELKTSQDFLLLQSSTALLNQLPLSAAPAAGTTGCHCHLSNTNKVKKKVKLRLSEIFLPVYFQEEIFIVRRFLSLSSFPSLVLATIQSKVTL